MRPIPVKLKKEMEADPFYKKCCITGLTKCKIDWHHNFTWQGRQLNEKWAILPLAEHIHHQITKYKEKCDWIMLNRATDDELRQYSKAVDYLAMRNRLNKQYGTSN